MAKRQKNRQHNGQKTEEQTTQWPKDRIWPLCCLFFCLLAIVLSVLLQYTDSDYLFGIFKLFIAKMSKKVQQRLNSSKEQ
jgi:lipopolysaccharide export LptBFGC system permease protein LptF